MHARTHVLTNDYLRFVTINRWVTRTGGQNNFPQSAKQTRHRQGYARPNPHPFPLKSTAMHDPDDDRPDYRRGPAPTPEPVTIQPDHRAAAEQRAADIAACGLCDTDGYRQLTVCDHTDHTQTAKAGIARVRAAMGWPQ